MLWIGAVLGVASAVLQGVQANKNGQKAKKASDAANSYADNLRAYKEANPYAAVQAPDIMSLTADRNAQAQAQSVAALQGSGAEGAGQITALTNAVDAANIDASQKQAELNYQRDAAEANAQGEINRRKEERDTALLNKEIEGAQLAAANATDAKNSNINGIMSGVGFAAGSLSENSNLDYLFKSKKTNPGTGNASGLGSFDAGNALTMNQKLITQ